MCDFPSWIVDENGKAWWLTDKDIIAAMGDRSIDWNDSVGHGAIEKVLGVTGSHQEGWANVPEKFLADITAGRCRKMAKTADVLKVVKHERGVEVRLTNRVAYFMTDGIEDRAGIRVLTGAAQAKAWRECKNAEHMLSSCVNIERSKLVMAACACARTVLHLVKKGDDRPRIAIETAEKWCRGDATIDEVKNAAVDAAAAAAAVDDAAAAADAAVDAVYAAVDAAVANAYAYATNAANASERDKHQRTMADLVRKHITIRDIRKAQA